MKQIGQLNETDLKAYQAGDKSVVDKYMIEASGKYENISEVMVDLKEVIELIQNSLSSENYTGMRNNTEKGKKLAKEFLKFLNTPHFTL